MAGSGNSPSLVFGWIQTTSLYHNFIGLISQQPSLTKHVCCETNEPDEKKLTRPNESFWLPKCNPYKLVLLMIIRYWYKSDRSKLWIQNRLMWIKVRVAFTAEIQQIWQETLAIVNSQKLSHNTSTISTWFMFTESSLLESSHSDVIALGYSCQAQIN